MSGVLYQRRGVVAVPNATALDERLSCRALGLLLIMLARPAGSRYDMREFAKGEGREGRDALLTAAGELRTLGYLHTTKVRLGNGQYITHTVVADEPITVAQAEETWAQNQPQNPEKPPEPPGSRAQPGTERPGTDFQTPVTETPVSLTPSLTAGSLRSPTQENQKGPRPKNRAPNPPRGSCPRCYVFHPAHQPCHDTSTTDHQAGAASVRAALKPRRLDDEDKNTPPTREDPAA